MIFNRLSCLPCNTLPCKSLPCNSLPCNTTSSTLHLQTHRRTDKILQSGIMFGFIDPGFKGHAVNFNGESFQPWKMGMVGVSTPVWKIIRNHHRSRQRPTTTTIPTPPTPTPPITTTPPPITKTTTTATDLFSFNHHALMDGKKTACRKYSLHIKIYVIICGCYPCSEY